MQWIVLRAILQVPFSISSVKIKLTQLLREHRLVLLIMLVALCISALIFRGLSPESALLLQWVGLGMIRISIVSFFWVALPVLLLIPTFIYVNKNTQEITSTKWEEILLLALLNIGNLLYFFGRSHENNLVNIAVPSVLLFFAFLSHLPKYWMKYFLPALFLMVFIYTAPRMRLKLGLKGINLLREHHIIQPTLGDTDMNEATRLKILTHNDPKVYIMDLQKEVMLNYFCGYKCLGHFQPTAAWYFEPDRRAFLNNLIDNGYAIVTADSATYVDAIQPLVDQRKLSVIYKYKFWKVNK